MNSSDSPLATNGSDVLRSLNAAERKSVQNCLDWYMVHARESATRVRFYSVSPDLDPERVNHAIGYCLNEIERAVKESFKELENDGSAG